MGKRFYKSLRIKNREEFLKTIIPNNPGLENRIGAACVDSAERILTEIRDKRNSSNYDSHFSIKSEDNIYRYLEINKENVVDITIKTLNTLLCFFFYKKPKNDEFAQEHTGEDLIQFFSHIKIVTGYEQDKVAFHKFLEDLELIKEHLTPLFNNFSFEINEKNFSIVPTRSLEDNDHPIQASNSTDTTFPSDLPEVSLDKISNYRKKVSEEFKEIRLGFDSFPLPINNVVELPFFRLSEKKEIQRELLRDELRSLDPLLDENKDLIDNIQDEINSINNYLDKKREFLNILDKREDIFILSPAGSGKTTTLKWLAYNLSNEENQIPIFVELQSYKSDLIALIEYSIDNFELDLQSVWDEDIILLVDGFDEYNGTNQAELVRELKDFKKKTNCQIVFTGRFKPIGLEDEEFNTYRLSTFSSEDIKRIFNNMFPEKGQYYCTKLERADLLRYIDVPLYLMFLISHIRKQGNFELKEITSLLENKGKLFKTVLIDDFLNDYELKKSKKIEEHRWIEIKTKQIELISIVAYYLTFNLKDKENAPKVDIVNYLESIVNSEKDYNQLFNDFKNHSILSFKRTDLGFDKKEVRLFFASYFLVKNDNDLRNYRRYRAYFSGKVSDSWLSVKNYLFGLIEPSLLLEDTSKFLKKEKIVLIDDFFKQLDLASHFIKSGNYKHKFKLLNQFYILNVLSLIAINDFRYAEGIRFIRFGKLMEFLFPIGKVKNSRASFSKILKYNFKMDFVEDYSRKQYLHRRLNDFDELFNIYYNNKNYFNEVGFCGINYKKIDLNTLPKHLSTELIDKTPNLFFSIIEKYIIRGNLKLDNFENKENKIKYQEKKTEIEAFFKTVIENYSNQFLDFYFYDRDLSIFSYKSLYKYYSKFNLKIDLELLLPETKGKIEESIYYLSKHKKMQYNVYSCAQYFIAVCLSNYSQYDILENPRAFSAN